MTRPLKRGGMIAALMAILQGCQVAGESGQVVTPAYTRPPALALPSSPDSGLAVGIIGRWRLVSFAGEKVPPDQLLITFASSSFSATVNCNRVGGPYKLVQNTFVPDKAYAAERGCGPPYKYDEALTRTLQSGMLLHLSESGTLVGQVGERRLVLSRIAE